MSRSATRISLLLMGLIALIGTIGFTGCRTGDSHCKVGDSQLSYRVLPRGSGCSTTRESTYFGSQEEWDECWIQRSLKPRDVDIDWETEEIIYLIGRGGPTGGYSIEINSISMIRNDPSRPPYLYVDFTSIIPGDKCIVIMMPTVATKCIAIPRQNATEVKFHHREKIRDC